MKSSMNDRHQEEAEQRAHTEMWRHDETVKNNTAAVQAHNSAKASIKKRHTETTAWLSELSKQHKSMRLLAFG